VVLCDGEGLAIFDKLHSRTYDGEVSLYPFDLLELDGTDWRPRTLEERKARAGERLANAPPGIQYREHVEGDGAVSGGTAKSAASIPDFSGLWRHLWPLWPRPDPVGQYEGLPLDAAEHRG
jgi:hypothetical protein